MPPLNWPKAGQSNSSDAGHAPLRTSNRDLLTLSDRGYLGDCLKSQITVDLDTRFFRKTWYLTHLSIPSPKLGWWN